MRLSALAAPLYVAGVDLFSRSWTALRAAVAALRDADFAQPSGCTGWLVRDLVCHRPDRASAGCGGTARGGARPVPRDAGGARRGRVPRVVLRQGRAAGWHRAAYPDRGGAGRTGRAGRATPAVPRVLARIGGTVARSCPTGRA
ncbi:maleylpyruvate isomerase N-terminal domain-containing protein [Streptomyces platensis]|uniref:maleylpyruvate isomerase N-terminal domain-containing protein n=1 Tax=Streptomyces platensis TaxID=58346 RepID=UPI0030E50F57